MTHLGRANAMEPHEDASAEIDAAMRHLKRTVLDCLKDSLAFINRDVENLVTDLRRNQQPPAFIQKEAAEIRGKRKALSISAGQSPTDAAIDAYAHLYTSVSDFQDMVFEEYDGVGIKSRNRRARNRSLLGLLAAFAIGIITSILGGWIVTSLM